ncbi:MAG: LysR family transcriptional regulator [Promethearchaeota archaeon]|nr:MAG: LysR family transcriptional regulator [Candidatus Lokiarchaeota archaeon]
MNIEYLRNFINLAQYKSFSDLAKDISISQSTLSHRIDKVEEEIGNIKLINRTTKSFKLTKAGEILLKYAQKIVNLYDECRDEIKRLSKLQFEEIVVSASKLPGTQILPKFFTEFKDSNPQVNFEIVVSNSRSSIDLLKKGFADFSGIGSFMDYNKEEFESIVIGTDELFFVCSPNHEIIKEKGTEVTFDTLKEYPFIQREKGSGTRNVFQSEFPKYENLNLTLELNDNDSIITAVSESNFISVLSKEIAERAKEAKLIEILKLKEYPIIAKRKLYFIKLKEKKIMGLKRGFWEFLKNAL